MTKALRTSVRTGGLRQGGLQAGLGSDSIFATASLDLNFAVNKNLGTLVDATTGSNLVDFTRASSGTYVGSDGLIKTAVTNLLLRSEEFDDAVWVASVGISVTVNQIEAPNGTLTADLIAFGAADRTFRQDVVGVSGTTYTVSFYVKGTAGETLRVGSTGIPGVVANRTLTGGWDRFTFTGVSNQTTIGLLLSTFGGATARNIYLWGAQAEQSSTVGEYVKTTSTINSAPRFDHDPETGESLGLLVEESRTNLYVYSEDASQWAYTNGSYYLDSAAIAPDGSAGAYVVYPTSNIPRINPGNISLVSGTRYTFSVFCKAKEFSTVGCFWNTTSIDPDVYGSTTFVNLNTGVSSDPSIVQTVGYPNGWWRLIINGALADANATAHVTIVPGSTGNPNTIVPNGTDGIYAWGAQMEASASFPTSYIPTTTAAVTRAADVAGIYDDNFGVFRTNLLQYSEEFDQVAWNKTNSLISPNAVISPDNKLTADKHTHVGSGPRISVFNAATISAGASFTFSFYAKAGTASFAAVSIYDGTTSGNRFWFNLLTGQAGSITSIGSGYPAQTSTITSVGDGWYRCTATITNGSNTTVNIDGLSACLDTNGLLVPTVSGVYGYLWGAQLEEGSAATPYIKSDVNWTNRDSNATYYDVNGTLKKSSYNLLTYSEELDNAAWTDSGTFTWTPSTNLAPDGSLTVDKPSVVFTHWAFYDATNSAFLSGYPAAFPFTVTSSWTRQSVTITAPAGCTSLRFYPGRVGVSGSYFYQTVTVTPGTTYTASAYYKLDSASSTVLVWGAQLETGTYAGDYAKTTTTAVSTPRTAAYLPDSNGNFISAGPLLLEDAGTNFLTYSELFTGWSVNQLVPSTASVAAPDGSPTVQLFTEDNTTNVHRIFLASTTGNLTHTHSVFVKNASGTRRVYLSSDDAFGARQILTFDLQTGTLASNSGGWTDPFITAYPNGWYRIGGTITDDGVTTLFIVGLRDDALISYLGDGTSGIYVWGAQLEANPYPTSYIPTQGSTATRAADVSTSAATTVLESDWYRQDEGTVFCDSTRQFTVPTGKFPVVSSLNDGTTSNRINNSYITSNLAGLLVTTGGVSQVSIYPPTTASRRQLATSFAINSFSAAVNGGNVGTDASGTMPTVSQLRIGDMTGNNHLNGAIRRLTYWPQRLGNEVLQTITQ
jgi:hypothetical protein